jgi:hypothetical protein
MIGENPSSIWSPRFTLTPAIARGLMQIEAARALVDRTPLSPSAKVALRARARVRSSHFSTFIEGNRLTLEEAKAVIGDEKTEIEGRERDVSEVRNYWNALLCVEEWARKKKPLTEELIKRLHALVEYGPRARPTPYREGQNAIFEAVRLKAERCGTEGHLAEPEALRRLDHRARVVLGLFAGKDRITAPQVASELELSERMARNLLKGWVDDGWLEMADSSRRGRAYLLSAVYRQYIGSSSATAQRSKNNEL